ncbi:glutaredoxin family protein [Rothia sp. CCM 9418]|uniref:glutaredoxin family protein n=1 Tax=Rothia sp. CCM 9418 TaxID=3402661 RepID=UPI003AE060C3
MSEQQPAKTPIDITLLTKPGCHLCDKARHVVHDVTARLGLTFTELNIENSPELKARHAIEIPVVLVDGEVKDFWQINPRRLEKILHQKITQNHQR